jgi:hypothetical protein
MNLQKYVEYQNIILAYYLICRSKVCVILHYNYGCYGSVEMRKFKRISRNRYNFQLVQLENCFATENAPKPNMMLYHHQFVVMKNKLCEKTQLQRHSDAIWMQHSSAINATTRSRCIFAMKKVIFFYKKNHINKNEAKTSRL